MIAADSKLLTYLEAGRRFPKPNGKGRGVRFIRNAIKSGKLRGVELGYNAKYVAELDLLQFIENSKTRERARR